MAKGYKHAQQRQVHHPPNFAVMAERALHLHCIPLQDPSSIAMLYALLLFTAFQKDNIDRSGCAFEVHANNFAPG